MQLSSIENHEVEFRVIFTIFCAQIFGHKSCDIYYSMNLKQFHNTRSWFKNVLINTIICVLSKKCEILFIEKEKNIRFSL